MDFGASGLTFECLLTRMEGSTLVLTLNRPDARNAINWTMEQELWEALAAAQRIDAVRAVVLNGAGEMFSAGHDLKQVAKEARDGGPKVDGEWWARQTTMLPSWNFTKPFIAAVHGFVGPYANGILLTADLVIAAHGTKFSFEHSRTGVGRPWGPYALMYFMFPPRVDLQAVGAGRLDGCRTGPTAALRAACGRARRASLSADYRHVFFVSKISPRNIRNRSGPRTCGHRSLVIDEPRTQISSIFTAVVGRIRGRRALNVACRRVATAIRRDDPWRHMDY